MTAQSEPQDIFGKPIATNKEILAKAKSISAEPLETPSELEIFKLDYLSDLQGISRKVAGDRLERLTAEAEVRGRIAELWNPNLRAIEGNEKWVRERLATLTNTESKDE